MSSSLKNAQEGAQDRLRDVEEAVPFELDALRKVLLAHHWMTFSPCRFVIAVSKGNDSAQQYEHLDSILAPTSAAMAALKAVTFVVVVSLLPYFYAFTMLDYPCDAVTYAFRGGDLGTKWQSEQMKGHGCQVEDFLRSYFSIAIGPLMFAVIALIMGFIHALVHLSGNWNIMYGACGPARLIQALFYGYLRRKLYKTTFSRRAKVWWYIVGYLVILLEFFAIAVISRGSTATGLLIAYAVSELYLLITNTVMGVDSMKVTIVEAEIASNESLRKCFNVNGRTLAVSRALVRYIDERLSDSVLAEDESLSPQHAWPTQIYITDTNDIFSVDKLVEQNFGGNASTLALVSSK
eukprot:TRINITY_DN47681_c0_g1_i1.p1 TRINITY_DN47681_c0_g1~~TRINITY_DN47681_c0_g1_i1.p1  ORF type:complete len:350 (-),score=35.47 TRINITY_DN47681_c0_g1_i1:167-1216(-)